MNLSPEYFAVKHALTLPPRTTESIMIEPDVWINYHLRLPKSKEAHEMRIHMRTHNNRFEVYKQVWSDNYGIPINETWKKFKLSDPNVVKQAVSYMRSLRSAFARKYKARSSDVHILDIQERMPDHPGSYPILKREYERFVKQAVKNRFMNTVARRRKERREAISGFLLTPNGRRLRIPNNVVNTIMNKM